MGAGVPGVSEDEDVPRHGVKDLRAQSLRSSQKETRSVTHEKETSFKAIFWVRSVENRALGAHFSKPSPDKGRCLN